VRVSPHGGIAPFPRNASRSPRLLRAFPSKNMRYFARRLCVGSAQPRGRVFSPLNGTPTDYDFPFRAVSFVRPGVLGVPRPTRTHRSRIASRPRRRPSPLAPPDRLAHPVCRSLFERPIFTAPPDPPHHSLSVPGYTRAVSSRHPPRDLSRCFRPDRRPDCYLLTPE